MKVKENDKLEQIEYEPHLSLINQSQEQPEIYTKYQYPVKFFAIQQVITNKCNHLRSCVNLVQVRLEFNKFGSFKCPSQGCKQIISSEEQLIKDIRWYANEELNEQVKEAMVIEGKLFNKYYRSKKYTDYFYDKQIRSYIIQMMSKFEEKQHSINSLIIENLQSSKPLTQQIIYFSAICLLDIVKLTIPVRIMGCKHKECYDITSLLVYQKENAAQEKVFNCVAEGCYQKLDISNVQTMVTQLVMDLHLLTALKQSPPSAFKFIFNPNTFRIESEVQRKDGVVIDPAIYEYYRKRKANDKKDFTMLDYQQFERQVQQQITNILQQSITKEIEKKLRCQKYQVAQINMQDKFTGYTVEYPVRCKHTDNLNTICDLRSVIADFTYDKISDYSTMYMCKLCNQWLNNPVGRVQIQNQLYLDQNLLSRMFRDMTYLQTKVFNYDGKSYLRQELYDKYKFETSEFIKALKEKDGNLIVEFKNMYCSKDKNVPLQMPLLLKQCSVQSIIDFDTFYNEMQKLQFDIESSNGLILCHCDNCNKSPIKQIKGNVYYHEAFGQALQEFNKSVWRKCLTFNFDFQSFKLVLMPSFSSLNLEVKEYNDYSDNNYSQNYQSIDQIVFQNAFAQKKIQGKTYKLVSMKQTICDGLQIIHSQSGVSVNLNGFVRRMNHYITQSPELNKYHFVIISITLTLKSKAIKINVGKIKSDICDLIDYQYNLAFQSQKFLQRWNFQLIEIHINFFEDLVIIYNKNGVNANLNQFVEQINQRWRRSKKNEKNFKMEIVRLEVKLQNGLKTNNENKFLFKK